MSGDELVVFILSLILSVTMWGKWLRLCLSREDFGRARQLHIIGGLIPFSGLVLIFCVLRAYASYDVREDIMYLLFYTAFGCAWLALLSHYAGLCGLSFRDDWLERGNVSAAALGTGVLLGGAGAFAGANIGDGPGWWVVLVCALLATGALFLCWWLYNSMSHAMEHILIDRDFNAGVRLGSFLFAVGIIAGRSVAGDWTGLDATLADFARHGWPLIPYTVVTGFIDAKFNHPARNNISVAQIAFWGLLHLSIAALFLEWAGPWQ